MDVIGTVSGKIYRVGALLARAGEGAVYFVEGNASILLKIFEVHPTPRTVQKLELLARYAPKPAYTALPLENVADIATGTVIGFVQPFFDRTVPLSRAFDVVGRKLLGFSEALTPRVKLVRLVAESMARLHVANLVMGDVSDSNFLPMRNWLGRIVAVAVIDCNSLQLTIRTNSGNEIFPSGVATEAYTAPEVQPTDWSKSPRTVFSDSFGFAVLAWMLLFNGSHPFAVASPRNVDVPPLGERIQLRQFPYSPASPLPAGWSAPPLDPSLGILPNDLREMFFRAFSTLDPRDRPMAKEWVRAFRQWEADPKHQSQTRTLGPWRGPIASRVANLLSDLKSRAGLAIVFVGLVLMATLLPRLNLPANTADEPESIRPALLQDRSRLGPSQPKPRRPRFVDRELFPETFWNPSSP